MDESLQAVYILLNHMFSCPKFLVSVRNRMLVISPWFSSSTQIETEGDLWEDEAGRERERFEGRRLNPPQQWPCVTPLAGGSEQIESLLKLCQYSRKENIFKLL